ncbi:putative short chain dehydrogenase [metagenome]|uniref:Putative short chain dehydrogenase n=1 Tax=metagenome TaxID=256318 RepID=A0A2P2CHW0_9ZZZZ
MKDVSGATVLVTGAAMGMGRLFAERAVREGAAAVVLVDINGEALTQAAGELRDRVPEGSDIRVVAETVDVRDPDQVSAAAERIADDVGTVTVLVNNAGVVRGNGYFWETDPADAQLTLEVNALAPMLMARAFLPGMIQSGRECRLVNVASAAGLTANPRMAAYAGSKWAVVGWSDSVRLELEQAGHRQVKVSTVCPYYVKTGMFDGARSAPLLPLLEPEDVVDQTWAAMLKGQPMLVLPRTVLISEVAKGLLPIGVRDFVADKVLGIYHTMDDFTGRSSPGR